MYIQWLSKNKNYVISKRDFLSDYSLAESKKIDMTLSGKYLSKYGNLNFEISKIDNYPFKKDIVELENILKRNLNINKCIIIGNGVNGLIQNIVKILFINKGNLVTPYYTFNQVEFGVSSFNCYTKRVFCDNYQLNLEKILKSIDRKTRMIYICNPNNPTGIYIESKKLLEFTKKVNIPVVIDESGIEFSEKTSILDLKEFPENLIVLRSFSKAYGIANLRIGYLICNDIFKQKYIRKITTNEFSGISCDIAKSIIKKPNINENIIAINKERKKLEKGLINLGIELIDTDSNIIMTKTKFISNFIEILEKNDISVVPVYDEYNGLHIRIAVQSEKTNDLFIAKMRKLMKKEYIL